MQIFFNTPDAFEAFFDRVLTDPKGGVGLNMNPDVTKRLPKIPKVLDPNGPNIEIGARSEWAENMGKVVSAVHDGSIPTVIPNGDEQMTKLFTDTVARLVKNQGRVLNNVDVVGIVHDISNTLYGVDNGTDV